MQQRAGRLPPLTSASIQREADLAAHAPPTLRARLVRRQLLPQTKGRATRQRRSDAKKRLACAMTTPHRHRTHPSDSRSRGLPEQRASLRSALAPFLGKANATRGHCLPGGATRLYRNHSMSKKMCRRAGQTPLACAVSRARVRILVRYTRACTQSQSRALKLHSVRAAPTATRRPTP